MLPGHPVACVAGLEDGAAQTRASIRARLASGCAGDGAPRRRAEGHADSLCRRRPSRLYLAILIKRRDLGHDVVVLECNPAGVTCLPPYMRCVASTQCSASIMCRLPLLLTMIDPGALHCDSANHLPLGSGRVEPHEASSHQIQIPDVYRLAGEGSVSGNRS